MGRDGWLTPGWSVEYGGRGLDPLTQKILAEGPHERGRGRRLRVPGGGTAEVLRDMVAQLGLGLPRGAR
jgi:alkylation response protein AidB-like acyl-CoA dehydrogenase